MNNPTLATTPKSQAVFKKIFKRFQIVFSSVNPAQNIFEQNAPVLIFFKHSNPELTQQLARRLKQQLRLQHADFTRSKYDEDQTGLMITAPQSGLQHAVNCMNIAIKKTMKPYR